ncbi:transposase [Planctomycetales bacterium ZRK34]|nr:transposase [Planctomycetales bacterium ZRK34]
MRRTRDRSCGMLFNPWDSLGEKRRRLLDRSWAGVFREHLLDRLPVEAIAECFVSKRGRPTKELHVAVGVLILQQLHDLTDAAVVEALAFNLAWHYALDVQDESDAYLCEKTLRNYRRRVIERGLDEVLFQTLTDELIDAFGVDASRQRLDSTSIRSAMRILTRLGTVVETISKFLRELARTHPGLHEQVDADLVRRYVARQGEGCFADASPSESKRRLPEAGIDLWHLVQMFEATQAAQLPSYEFLARVFNEQFEVSDKADRLRIKEPREIPCDNVLNPADPDSSYNKHRGQGYLAQVMETYQEDDDAASEQRGAVQAPKPDLITHVSVDKMTVADTKCFEPALEDVAARDHKPTQVLADSAYGSHGNLDLAASRDVTLVSPAKAPHGAERDLLMLEHFDLDDGGHVLRCPAGHAPQSTRVGGTKHEARFDPAVCAACPLQDRCPTHTHRRVRRLRYIPSRARQRRRRLQQQSPTFRQCYRWRAGIEATMARLKHQMKLACLRVRGMKAVTYVVLLRALGLNIRRCSAFLAA